MRPISESTARITSKSFSRKFISLGRILGQWEEIVGSDFASKAQPIKLNYRKNKKTDKPLASLDIATTSAYSVSLHYQKNLILERINRIFGSDWISDIRFVTVPTEMDSLKPRKVPPPLTLEEKKYLSDMLASVQDEDIRKKLESLGHAILTEAKE